MSPVSRVWNWAAATEGPHTSVKRESGPREREGPPIVTHTRRARVRPGCRTCSWRGGVTGRMYATTSAPVRGCRGRYLTPRPPLHVRGEGELWRPEGRDYWAVRCAIRLASDMKASDACALRASERNASEACRVRN